MQHHIGIENETHSRPEAWQAAFTKAFEILEAQ